MGNTRGSILGYKPPKKTFGAKVKEGLKKAAGSLKSSLLSSAAPESVQKTAKTVTKTTKTGFKEGLKRAAGKVVKGWHKG